MIKTPLSTMIGGAGIWTPGATTIGAFGAKKTLDQFIRPLFANNEQGFTRTPDDLTTMFQDAVGPVPVTGVSQPIGLMLDKSKGMTLGEELFVSPTLTGQWVSDGNNVYTCNNSVGLSDLSIDTAVVNNSYVIGFEVIENIVAVTAYQFSGAPTNITTTGIFNSIRLATNTRFLMRMSAGRSAKIRLITAKELKGSHAYQTTSSMRPLLVASPQRLDYDTADDKLVTTLPAQLTGCTVVRAVPNVGTQILTNQTIPTPYNDNTDHCGLIVINRALTAIETSQITQLFNKAAGV